MNDRITSFPKSLRTPHDLAMALGPWILPSLVVGPVVVGIFALSNKWIGFGMGLASAAIWFFLFRCALSPFLSFDFSLELYALREKYATQGERLQGTVLKRNWLQVNGGLEGEGQGGYHLLEVVYQVGEVVYQKVFKWPNNVHWPIPVVSAMVNLVYFPGYPKSALYYDCVKYDYSNFLPADHARDRLPIEILLTTCVSFSSCACIPLYAYYGDGVIGAVPYIWLTVALTMLMVVLSFMWAYRHWKWLRDIDFQRCLYGAKQRKQQQRVMTQEEQQFVSYDDFFHIEHNDRLSYRAVLQLAVEGTLWCVYFVPFYGSYLIWKGVAVHRWKKTLLKRYDSESDITSVTGTVVTFKDYSRLTFKDYSKVTVQYKANDNQWYMKQLTLPHQAIPNMPDRIVLVYIKELPESAIYRVITATGVLDHHHLQIQIKHQTKQRVWLGLVWMAFQIGLPIWLVRDMSLFWNNVSVLTFIVGVCNFVMGFVGVWSCYPTIVEKEMFGIAKQVEVVDSDDGTETTESTL
jgi:hypothetical protein